MFYYIYKIQHYFFSGFVVLFLYTKYPKYTDLSLTTSGGTFFYFPFYGFCFAFVFTLLEKAVSAHYSRTT